MPKSTSKENKLKTVIQKLKNNSCTKCSCCKYTIVIIIAFLLGIFVKCWFSCPHVAVIDVQKLIDNMEDITYIQKELAQKQEELEAWVKEAQEKVAKEKQKAAKEELTKKLEQEFFEKQQALKQDYTAKLNYLDAKVTKFIKKKACKLGYKIVVNKNSIIAGGDDITDKIIELMKKL